MPTATILTPPTQVPKATLEPRTITLNLLAQELEGAHWNRGPSLTVPQPQEATILAEMVPLYINVGDTKWIYCCQVEGCPEGHLTSCAAIFAHVHWTNFGMKLSCPSCPHTFFNTDALQQHDKQVHPSGSSNPV